MQIMQYDRMSDNHHVVWQQMSWVVGSNRAFSNPMSRADNLRVGFHYVYDPRTLLI